MNKRGISAIVATVMIILVTVALVALLWAVIIPLINDQLRLAEECRKAQSSITIEFACTTHTNITGSVKRNSEEFNLLDLQFGTRDHKGNLLAVFAASQFNLTIPNINEKRRYTVDVDAPSIANVDRLQELISLRIAPVVQYKKKIRTCEPFNEIELPWCDSINPTTNRTWGWRIVGGSLDYYAKPLL